MKKKTEMDPAAAFPDARLKPSAKDLRAALGEAVSPLDVVLTAFCSANPSVSTAWQYSERSGWYHLFLQKKRRILYLVPKRGDYRAMMILGGKALARLQAGPQARQTIKLLKTAKHYPEGTAFTFTHENLDPGLLAAFLSAKIAH